MNRIRLLVTRFVLIYSVGAGLWGAALELLLVTSVSDPRRLLLISLFLWIFVAASAVLVYILVRRAALANQAADGGFRRIIERNADGIVIVDNDGYVRFANPAATQIFGRPSETLLGQPFGFPLVAGEKAEVDIIRPDVTITVAEMRVVEIIWEETPTYLASLRDVTDRKEAEAVRRDLALLKEADRLQKEFVSNVSHELRTPLSVLTLLSGNLDALYDRIDDGKRRGLVRDIREYVRRLNELVASVLEISRIDHGRVNVELREIDLAWIIRDEAAYQMPLAQRKSQQLYLIGEEPLPVPLSEGQFRQIVRNLLNNAIKYTPTGGEITCEWRALDLRESAELGLDNRTDTRMRATTLIPLTSLRHADNWPGNNDLPRAAWAALRVSDTGVGISPADQRRIFERFYRVEAQGNVPGTGLGLAIVRELVKLHNGHVAVVSKPGQGSTFAVYLPLSSTTAARNGTDAQTLFVKG